MADMDVNACQKGMEVVRNCSKMYNGAELELTKWRKCVWEKKG